ncbi:MAG: hypothetical protein OXN84_00680 [Albidovulum sp.]|nr:hypothetical protein [Albidovulum sp.]
MYHFDWSASMWWTTRVHARLAHTTVYKPLIGQVFRIIRKELHEERAIIQKSTEIQFCSTQGIVGLNQVQTVANSHLDSPVCFADE